MLILEGAEQRRAVQRLHHGACVGREVHHDDAVRVCQAVDVDVTHVDGRAIEHQKDGAGRVGAAVQLGEQEGAEPVERGLVHVAALLAELCAGVGPRERHAVTLEDREKADGARRRDDGHNGVAGLVGQHHLAHVTALEADAVAAFAALLDVGRPG